ncbi:MAG TPA: CBS domain-containing protein [Pyrinomonadaceae bacterium]|jgi:CBS domain-containing protein|nr:CBS domain-containing protein [Pyrinomonadaceae bacterium]
MSAEQSAGEQKSVPQTPADKTDGPRGVRHHSVSLLETNDYVCTSPSTPLAEAVEKMRQDEGGCVIICEDERVVGIFTERDLLNKIVGSEIDTNEPVSRWMSSTVETLGPEATIGDAVRVMNDKGYRNVPLVQDGRLVGSVSVFDVIMYLAESYPKETMNLPPVPAQVMDTQEGG